MHRALKFLALLLASVFVCGCTGSSASFVSQTARAVRPASQTANLVNGCSVNVAGQTPVTVTPAPQPTRTPPTPTPMPSVTASPAATPSPGSSPTPSQVASPTPTPVSSATPSPGVATTAFGAVDCYLPSYSGTITQDFQIGFSDQEDVITGADNQGASATCGPIQWSHAVMSGDPSQIIATDPGVTQPCPQTGPVANPGYETIRTTIQVTGNPAGGPTIITLVYNGASTVTDPSDFENNPVNTGNSTGNVSVPSAVIYIHLGSCAPTTSTSSARRTVPFARRLVVVKALPADVVPGRTPQLSARGSDAGAHRLPDTGQYAHADYFWDVEPSSGGPPAACPTLPAPTSTKSLYTASLQSQPQIAFTDAADASFGPLTWQFNDPSNSLTKLGFAQASTTAPHADNLSMTVDPSQIAPGDYPISVSVQDNQGDTSPATIVTLRVLQPAALLTTLNGTGVYEEDSSGAITVSDGSDQSDVNYGQQPDFPVVPSITPSAWARHPSHTRLPSQFTASGLFNPFQPPTKIASALSSFSLTNAGCVTVLDDTNQSDDRTSGSRANVGMYIVYGYCNFTVLRSAPYAIELTRTAENLNTHRESGHDLRFMNTDQMQPLGTYTHFTVFATPPVFATPVSRIAEKQTIDYALVFQSRLGMRIVATGAAGGRQKFYVNNFGVFYPKIRIADGTALDYVMDQADRNVPFPKGPFFWCGVGGAGPGCLTQKDGRKLAVRLKAKLKAVPGGWQAHHIIEVSWCGSNSEENGVFLPKPLHDQFTQWFRSENFTPDNAGGVCEKAQPPDEKPG